MRPFRRSLNGDFEMAEGERLIRAAVGLVLGTLCTSEISLGELPWRTEFGSLLPLLRLQNNDAGLYGLAQYYVVKAIERWVPAVRIRKVNIASSASRPELLAIVVTYDIVDPPSARVVVPGIQTAVQLGA